jgi:hypothetical protein
VLCQTTSGRGQLRKHPEKIKLVGFDSGAWPNPISQAHAEKHSLNKFYMHHI